MKRILRLLTGLALGIVLSIPPMSASASSDWSPVGSADEGFHEIVIQDSVPFFRQFSFLHVSSNSKEFVCADMSRGICESPQAAQFNVILPVCSSASDTDCIESIASSSSGGLAAVGQFDRYSMPTHPSLCLLYTSDAADE